MVHLRESPLQSLIRLRPYAGVALVLLCAAAASVWATPGPRGWFGAALAAIMIAIAAVDARRFIIPDNLSLLALALGVLNAIVFDPGPAYAAIGWGALRGAVFAALVLALRAAYQWLRGREGIGLGDVKLAGVAGVWLDWTGMAVAIEIAALAALLVIGLRAARGHRVTATMAIPFGLFLAPAIWLAWLIEVLVL